MKSLLLAVAVSAALTACYGYTKGSTSGYDTTPLEGTYWKIVSVDTARVTVANNQREPSLTLHAKDHRASGSGGCNGFAGGYTLKDDSLTFSRMASTLMACPAGMEQEHAILTAFDSVKQWTIRGDTLHLLGARGEIMRLEARYMK